MLVTVTGCVELVPVFTLPKLTVLVLSEIVRVAVTPVPLRAITLGEVAELLTIVMFPLDAAAAVGWY